MEYWFEKADTDNVVELKRLERIILDGLAVDEITTSGDIKKSAYAGLYTSLWDNDSYLTDDTKGYVGKIFTINGLKCCAKEQLKEECANLPGRIYDEKAIIISKNNIIRALNRSDYFEIGKIDGEFAFKFVKRPLKHQLRLGFNITIDYVSELLENTIYYCGEFKDEVGYKLGTLVDVIVDIPAMVLINRHDKYLESIYTAESGDKYSIFDVYVVHNDKDIFYCTREYDFYNDRHVIESNNKYREKEHIYFDINTGHQICSDKDKKDYEINNLAYFYNKKCMQENGFNLDASLVSEEMAGRLLSEKEELTRK